MGSALPVIKGPRPVDWRVVSTSNAGAVLEISGARYEPTWGELHDVRMADGRGSRYSAIWREATCMRAAQKRETESRVARVREMVAPDAVRVTAATRPAWGAPVRAPDPMPDVAVWRPAPAPWDLHEVSDQGGIRLTAVARARGYEEPEVSRLGHSITPRLAAQPHAVVELTYSPSGRRQRVRLAVVVQVTFGVPVPAGWSQPERQSRPVVHANGDRHDCRLSNLRWALPVA